MTRLYLKIFLTFWLITATIIVGTNVVVHWFDMTPDGNLQNAHLNHDEEPAKRLLFQMAGSIINRNAADIRKDIRALPAWSSPFIFALDNNNQDVLNRLLPPGVLMMAEQLNAKHPYEKIQDRNRKLFGRYITLNDGDVIKLVTISDGLDEGPDRDIIWELFINNIWPLLLVSILVSGSACFLLARHFTSSIKSLQETIQKVSHGDLSARVSKHFSGRKDEIAALGRDFDHMTARLEKAMLEQKRLIKDVSHELRTPLARLQFALALAQQRSQGIVDNELERIKQAADYLGNIITEILSLPVHDQQGWQLDDTLDLVSLLQSIISDYEQMADEKSISIHFNSHCDEALVATYGNMLVGVFENILRNAIHYTPIAGNINVGLLHKTDENIFSIEIADSGTGVPEELLNDIFQPFFRTDSARDRESGGHGLGLAIAHRSVTLHYGKIWAENKPEGGLKITVEIPALAEEDDD
ncbi:two-component sensor histidine kinase [Cellvibrio zantedeschiae]|uniref:histidine kinase n=1 Tax=Cellvibrio zantedeschiae TaxID=1237077 RepID=A0ABQ3B2J8_9GAMM|nr:ATP-binding protein [Cellvibrio zantedeschiae]GGY72684.1 two-component sensor histidine kinase [Cellvibrio zantedeschiae]